MAFSRVVDFENNNKKNRQVPKFTVAMVEIGLDVGVIQ